MCRSGNLIFYHKDLNSAHFSGHLKKKIMKIGALVLNYWEILASRHNT